MIVEERKTKAKARLRFLVLLVKFLMILSVSIRTPNIVFRSRILGRGQTRGKNATRRSAGRTDAASAATNGRITRVREGSLILYHSFRSSSSLLYPRIFYTHSSTVSCIGQSNDSTHCFLVISRATFLLPFSLHFPSSPHSSSHAHAPFLSHTFSLTYGHTHSYAFSLCWSFLLPA